MTEQARSQDFSWEGGGGRVGVCSPGKGLEIADCFGLHFARFHGGEKEKENVELLTEKVNHQRLIF